MSNCTISGNSAYNHGGGSQGGILIDCTLSGNTSEFGGGSSQGTLNNCTLSGNSANGVGGGAIGCTLNNCIVYFNTAPTSPNVHDSTVNYSCTTPLPGGTGNTNSDPQFVNAAAGNFRLLATSPQSLPRTPSQIR